MGNREITIELPHPHNAQLDVIAHSARFKVANCGRRFGKTTLGIDAIIRHAWQHPVDWMAPTYKMVQEVWQILRRTLAPVTARKDETLKRLELITGGVIRMWSLDNYDAIRGIKSGYVVWDECAATPNGLEIWNAVIRPVLTDLEGGALFLSTPRGHNHFWQFYNRGLDDAYSDWHSWQLPSASNPYLAQSELDNIRYETPEHYFKQEYLAEFLADFGMVFRGVSEIATLAPAEPDPAETYVMGVDWGRVDDFTVVSVLDSQGRQVAIDRFNRVGWSIQRERLKALAQQYKPRLILAEANSIGEPNIEALQNDGLKVEPFTTTSASKQPLIDDLANAIEAGKIALLNDAVQTSELQSYEMTRTASGKWAFSAPDGGHDDTVIALALAWRAHNTRPAVAQTIRNPFF